jgi:hypothetical protein
MRIFARKPSVPQRATPAKSATLDRSRVEQSADVNGIAPFQDFLKMQRALGNRHVQRMVSRARARTLENQFSRPLQSSPPAQTGEFAASLGGVESSRFGHDFSLIPVDSPLSVDAGLSPRGLRSAGILPKFAIGGSQDAFEQEADRVADRVANGPLQESEPPRIPVANLITPRRDATSAPRVGKLDRNRTPGGPDSLPPIVDEVLRTAGQPQDPATRTFMEPRFGHDFAKVRLHVDQRAAMSANAIGALAYTCGESIVFGPGQHRPDTKEGRHLLAHELAHVVQQAQQPSGLIRRQPSKDDEEKKRKRIAHHERQQKLVAGFLADARKIKPKSTKDVLDPDTLFHNTAQLVDPSKTAKASLKVLTPTHYSTHDAPVYFDIQVAHPQIGGDYPADPAKRVTVGVPGSSLITALPDVGGQTGFQPQPQATGVSTSSKREEHAPERVSYKQPPDPKREPSAAKTAPPATKSAAPAATFSPAEIKLFIGNGDGTSLADITLDEFKKNLVHEGQHVSDWSLGKTDPVEWKRVLERYKSEFRAFSIQPPQSAFGKPTPIGSSAVRPSIRLTAGEKCEACGGTASSPSTQQTAMKNERQERIFLNLITSYAHEKFSCFYVCNQDFRDAVNAYDAPSSMNLEVISKLRMEGEGPVT